MSIFEEYGAVKYSFVFIIIDNNKTKETPIKLEMALPINFDPLKPHFYIVKMGFTRVYIIFLISAQKHGLWVLVRTASLRRF